VPPLRPHDASSPAAEGDYLAVIDALGRRIRDPVEKLRFFRGSLAVPVSPEGGSEPFSPATPAMPAPRRRWPIGPALLALSSVGVGCIVATALVFGPMAWSGGRVSGAAVVPPEHRIPPPVVVLGASDLTACTAGIASCMALSPGAPRSQDGAEADGTIALAMAPAEGRGLMSIGLRPTEVWLVESGEGWEQYSNGLRIETGNAVRGEPRRYRVFTLSGGMGEEVVEHPVGILFHTTESHVWPLEATYNDNLRRNSRNLVGHVARDRLYNYVIDRFGRVYRSVEDETKANHAGHGVWQHGEQIYLNLNHAFLGVSFETRWDGGKELPLTEAQIVAGRNLTAWLRHRWNIPPEMCVTHGLTSVNPRSHLVGYHVDWARGFPFAAFDLPDQYQRPAPSVLLFGFGYDADFVRAVGEPWAGLREAERLLDAEAAASGRSVADLRRERRALFRQWLREQAEADDTSQRAATARTTSGGG